MHGSTFSGFTLGIAAIALAELLYFHVNYEKMAQYSY